jgi:hypothetical protein
MLVIPSDQLPLGRSVFSKKCLRPCGPILSLPSSPAGAFLFFLARYIGPIVGISLEVEYRETVEGVSPMPVRETQHVHSNTAHQSQNETFIPLTPR